MLFRGRCLKKAVFTHRHRHIISIRTKDEHNIKQYFKIIFKMESVSFIPCSLYPIRIFSFGNIILGVVSRTRVKRLAA